MPIRGALWRKIHEKKEKSEKNKVLSAFLGLFFGPFGYLYVGRIKRFILGFLILFFLISILRSYVMLLLPLFALDCYFVAKNIENEKIKELNKIEEIQKKEGKEFKYIFCSQCGTKNEKDAKFCSKCGEKI
jgi:ribosomal protein L40E/TM2 domain-containing membrane protein YozV